MAYCVFYLSKCAQHAVCDLSLILNIHNVERYVYVASQNVLSENVVAANS